MSGPRSDLLAGRPQPPMLCSSSWRCQAELASVLKLSAADCPAQNDEETPSREHCVLLELPTPSKGDNSCTLSLLCAAQGKDRILGITIHSEARTIEIYSALQNGKEEEYLGTSRGERFCTLESSGEESPAVLYKAHLKFEFPVPSCIVKLLSLGGRCSVLVSEISVQITPVPDRCPQAPYVPGSSINLDRVQSIMDSMGGKMSPGAEQLMNMVRAQQKHQAPFGAQLMQLFGSFQHGRDQIREEARQHKHNASTTPDTKVENQGQESASHSSVQQTSPENPMKSVMSSLLQTTVGSAASPQGPDALVPLLRNLCGQNRQEPSSALKEEKMDPALEKLLSVHMERVERTLLAHIDKRMRSLQEHLDTRLDRLINLMQSNSLSQNSTEKLVNGQSEHCHQQDYDYDDLSMD
ncbi:ATPase PAAT isoform X1 [Ranitomeya imitator]|uniref:ATPase PAAT isoform X1 n=1 Tax=Ranitomeya imitator TaxID=111125 RepID=UPI0037E95B98